MNSILYRMAAGAFLTMLAASCGKKTEETKPIRKDVTETVFASGVLEANGTYSLTAQADGYLQQVNFSEGDVIKQGAVLAVIDNKESILNTQSAGALYNIAKSNTAPAAPLLAQAQNSIALAKQKMEQDAEQAERYKRLLDANSVARVEYENTVLQYNTSKSAYENAVENYRQVQQQAQQQLISNNTQKQVTNVLAAHNQLRAVVGGKVYKKYKHTGDFVRKGDVIASVGGAELIYAKVSIDETNIARVKVGQEVTIQLNTSKDKSYNGKVAEIYPAFDEGTQSFFCKLYFTDSLDFRITGTQLQANIIVGVQKNALLIPRNYLDFGGHVMIKGKKEPVKVTTGFVSSNWVQVLSGFDENAILVTENISANKITTSEAGAQMR
jgi:HlyD family secretion protein